MESQIRKTNKEVLERSKKHLENFQRALLDEAEIFFLEHLLGVRTNFTD